jgi:hypothetical protein
MDRKMQRAKTYNRRFEGISKRAKEFNIYHS